MANVAALSMYAHPELDDALAEFWGLIRQELEKRGIDAPARLTDDGIGEEFWLRPDLVLGQTCGYPFRTTLKDRVGMVGAFDHGLEGCGPGQYNSVLVVRADSPLASLEDLDGARLAYNSTDSQSGFHGPRGFASLRGVNLAPTLETGAHARSARAVADGLADVAGIDAVSWRDMRRFDDFTGALRVAAATPPVPALPLVCAKSFDAGQVAESVARAVEAMPEHLKDKLGIRGFVARTPEDYSERAFTPS